MGEWKNRGKVLLKVQFAQWKIRKKLDLQLYQNSSPIFHWMQAVLMRYRDQSHWTLRNSATSLARNQKSTRVRLVKFIRRSNKWVTYCAASCCADVTNCLELSWCLYEFSRAQSSDLSWAKKVRVLWESSISDASISAAVAFLVELQWFQPAINDKITPLSAFWQLLQ